MIFKKTKNIYEMLEGFNKTIEASLWEFENFLDIYGEGKDYKLLEESRRKIDELEANADSLRRKAVDDLLTHPMLPQTRTEILELILTMDKIPNRCQDISRQIVNENMRMSEEVKSALMNIISLTKGQLEYLFLVLKALFANYESIIKDHKLLEEISRVEKEIDQIEGSIIRKIFNEEEDLAYKVYMKTLINSVCDISDKIENIGDSIHIMAVLRKV